MKIPFYKYHGTGNDFIIIDNRRFKWNPEKQQVAFLCDRHFGIGADGLIFLTESDGYDFGMTYFNSDGNESSMCGNGGRCLTAFAHSCGLIADSAYFNAIDGEHWSKIIDIRNGLMQIRLKMKDVSLDEPMNEAFFLDTGSPHYVLFKENIDEINIVSEARKIRYNRKFAEHGTNVDFAEIREDHIYVRTYERGVEDETLSCGTGITASAVAAAFKIPGNPDHIKIRTKGGELMVYFKKKAEHFTDIWLEGPAKFVFMGEIEI